MPAPPSVPVCISLPKAIVDALDDRRAREDRSRSRLVLRYVRDGLTRDGALPPDAHHAPRAYRGT